MMILFHCCSPALHYRVVVCLTLLPHTNSFVQFVHSCTIHFLGGVKRDETYPTGELAEVLQSQCVPGRRSPAWLSHRHVAPCTRAWSVIKMTFAVNSFTQTTTNAVLLVSHKPAPLCIQNGRLPSADLWCTCTERPPPLSHNYISSTLHSPQNLCAAERNPSRERKTHCCWVL